MTVVDEATGAEIAVRDLTTVEKAIATGLVPEEVADPLAIQRAIFARLAQATTVDDILDQGSGLESWGDLEGVPVEVHDVRFNVSTYEQGAPVYAVVDVTVLAKTKEFGQGERVTLSCGGVNVMGQLVGLMRIGALPLKVKLTRAEKATRAGYHPLWLTKAA